MTNLKAILQPAYEPGDGRADGAQLVDGEWWHPTFGCDSLQKVVDNVRSMRELPPGYIDPELLAFKWNERKLNEFCKQFEQNWQLTGHERKAAELAERYHRETEAYDRAVCTGPIRDGEVMPISGPEMALSSRNAGKVREQIMREAAQHGISRQDMAHAISRHFELRVRPHTTKPGEPHDGF